MLKDMQETLPEEIKQARWIVKDREDLLGKARQDAERIVVQAKEDQLRMARKEEVVHRAEEEADRIVAEAEQQAMDARAEAESYVDARLAQFEIALRRILEEAQSTTRALAKTLDQVEVGRDRLRAPTTAAEQEFGTDPEAQLFDAEEDR
jgi:F0F1-type ATP synthase membrane subunit b/b'